MCVFDFMISGRTHCDCVCPGECAGCCGASLMWGLRPAFSTGCAEPGPTLLALFGLGWGFVCAGPCPVCLKGATLVLDGAFCNPICSAPGRGRLPRAASSGSRRKGAAADGARASQFRGRWRKQPVWNYRGGMASSQLSTRMMNETHQSGEGAAAVAQSAAHCVLFRTHF